jgi:hypothetical protein
MKTEKEVIDELVKDHLSQGKHVIQEADTYRQHLLREHPLVCRQTLKHSPEYIIHSEPCGCPATERGIIEDFSSKIAKESCCWIVQPVGSSCVMCEEEIFSQVEDKRLQMQ